MAHTRWFDRWILGYPGFWLNLLGLAVCSAIVLGGVLQEKHTVARKYAATHDMLSTLVAEHLNGAIIRDDAADQARIQIHLVLHDRAEDAAFESGASREVHDQFIEALRLPWFFSNVNGTTKDREAGRIAQAVAGHYREEASYLAHVNLYTVWLITTLVYVILVGVAYFSSAIDPQQGEPVLNIVDIGIYFTIVAYTGGLGSPIMWVLGFSVSVAALEFGRSIPTQSSGSDFKWQLGWRRAIGPLFPSIFYSFALLSGLLWASVDINTRIDGTYWWSYIVEVAFISAVAGGISVFVAIMSRLRTHRALA